MYCTLLSNKPPTEHQGLLKNDPSTHCGFLLSETWSTCTNFHPKQWSEYPASFQDTIYKQTKIEKEYIKVFKTPSTKKEEEKRKRRRNTLQMQQLQQGLLPMWAFLATESAAVWLGLFQSAKTIALRLKMPTGTLFSTNFVQGGTRIPAFHLRCGSLESLCKSSSWVHCIIKAALNSEGQQAQWLSNTSCLFWLWMFHRVASSNTHCMEEWCFWRVGKHF